MSVLTVSTFAKVAKIESKTGLTFANDVELQYPTTGYRLYRSYATKMCFPSFKGPLKSIDIVCKHLEVVVSVAEVHPTFCRRSFGNLSSS